jgi:hypothetical protein
MAAAAAPERIPAIVASGAWDPQPEPEELTETDEWVEALRRGGTSALVDRFKIDMGETTASSHPARGP